MNNPILISESFERAACSLQRTLENGLNTGNLEYAIADFGRHVERLCIALELFASANAEGGPCKLARDGERYRKALECIAVVDQGCGGNLRFDEMVESAKAQAIAALNETRS